MIKQALYILLAFVFANTAYAQEFESNNLSIEIGEPNSTKKNSMAQLFVGDDNVFSRSYIKRKAHLVKYDEDLQVESTLLLYPEILPKKSYIERTIAFNGAIIIFYSILDKPNKTNNLYYTIIDQADMSTLESGVSLMELEYTSKRNSGNFDISMSRDSSKLMIFANTPMARSRNAKDEAQVVVMNEEFEILWDQVVTIPHADRDFIIEQYKVDNDGNLFIVGRLYKQKSMRSKGKPGSTYKILASYDEGESLEEIDVELSSNKFISEFDFLVTKAGNLICTGLYSNESYGRAAGAFYLEIEAETLDYLVEQKEDFDLDFLTEGLTEKQTKKVKKKMDKGKSVEFANFKVRNIVQKADGGLVMVAEHHYVYTTTTTTTGANGVTTTTTTTHYIYGDIILVSFSEEGEIEWTKTVPKYQYSTNDGGYKSGFELTVKGDKMHFYYVNWGKFAEDLEYDKRTDRDNYRALHFVHETVDLDGELDAESMGTIEKRGLRPLPKKFVTLRNGQTIIYMVGKREYKLGIITPN